MDASVDVGLGTAYERVAVYRLLDRWFPPAFPPAFPPPPAPPDAARHPIATAFEGPVDNMAGIPGIHLVGLAARGTRVTVGLGEQRWLDNVRAIYRRLGVEQQLETRLMQPPDALPTKAYDLTVTYNALPVVDDWRALLDRVAQASRRWLVVALTNPSSYGVWIRKALRPIEGTPKQELFDHVSTQPATIERELGRLGSIVEHAYFDCPWWPDLFVDAGESLLGATLKRLPLVSDLLKKPGGGAPAAPNRYIYGADDFPLLRVSSSQGATGSAAELDRALTRHPVFDGRPRAVARTFGHLHAYLVRLTS
jgi:hypothetical protein